VNKKGPKKLSKILKARELRRELTEVEKILWKYLRDRSFFNKKFRRQHVFRGFILDFYCPEEKLAIELDGSVHLKQKDYDSLRQKCIEDHGIKVLHFKNKEITNSLRNVLQTIKKNLSLSILMERDLYPPKQANSEKSQGEVSPKFRTKFVTHNVPNDLELDKLKYWANEFSKQGLAPDYGDGAYGNLSYRVGSSFIITATRFGLKDQVYVKVLSVDFKNKIVRAEGEKEPSSESMLHYAIYEQRSDVNAIFHGHYEPILKANKFPATKKEEKYGSIELVDGVLEVLGQNDFIIMKNHGFISLGKDMDEAGQRALNETKIKPN